MTDQDQTTVRAAVYLRISRDATGEGLGVARQREDCLALCESMGWQVTEYADNDTSAYKNRPQFLRMLADIEAKRIDAIVAWQPDRLYRRFKDLDKLVGVIEAHGVMVRTIKAGDLNLDSAYGRMVARMLSVIAMGEGELKAERWKRSWRQGREQGKPARTGSRLFGYTHEGELIEAEAAIARGMAADLLAGVPLLEIANRLEAAGVMTTRNTVWRTSALRRYLTNPRIAGWSTLGRDEYVGVGKDGTAVFRRVRDIVAEGDWQPILDRESWEAVKAMLDARTRPYVPRKSLLNGIIFCICGERMVTSSQRKTRTYRCPNRPGMRGCGKVSGNAAPIEEVVEAFTKARLLDPRVRDRIAALRSEPLHVRQELAAIELRVTELEHQLDQPGVPVATILRAIERTRERQENLAATLAASHGGIPLPGEGDPWPGELAQRRALVDLVVEKVTLLPATRSSRLGFDPERVKIDSR